MENQPQICHLSFLKRILQVGVILAVLATPLSIVYADIGPKETMEFEFEYEAGTSLSIVEGVLLECNDEACTQAEPLPQIGPQRFTCTKDHCSSMAYGYRDYHRLSIVFSDGKTRQSNIFGKRYFAARYRVTVRENDLLVKELGGASNPLGFLLMLGAGSAIATLCLVTVLLIGILGIWVLLVRRGGGGMTSLKAGHGVYLAAWLIALPLVLGSTFVSIALLITVALEVTGGDLYALLRKRPMQAWLTLILLVNLLTQPASWAILNVLGVSPLSPWTLGIEVAIWLIETFLIYLPLRKVLSLAEVLGITLLLNALSFWVGLVLPI